MTLDQLRELRLNRQKPKWPIIIVVDGSPHEDQLEVKGIDFDYRPLLGLEVVILFDKKYIDAVDLAYRLDQFHCIVQLYHETERKTAPFKGFVFNGLQEPYWRRLKEWLQQLPLTTST